MKIIVSIVSYNTKDLIKEILENLLRIKSKNEIELWVLDNNSADESANFIEKNFPKIKLIKNQKNVGFGSGHNQIIKQAKGELYLLLNPDTKFSTHVVDQMVDFMVANKACGVASCKVLDFENHLNSNGGDLPFGMALINWLFNLEFLGNFSNFHRGEKSYFAKAKKVGWVGGTFMMIRREVFEKIGYFDEDYFMYFEDAEICYRAKKAGFEIMLNPEVSIKHLGGASSENPRYRQWQGEFWGLVHFYKKEFGFLPGLFVRLMVYKAIILRMIAFSLLGKFNTAGTYGKILFNI